MFHSFKKKKNLISEKKYIAEYNYVRADKDNEHICDAPFKSLLFIPTGEIMVCHYNRGYKLGEYPADAVREIWFGEKLKNLRQYISKNDFSLGCNQCFNELRNGNFNTLGARKYDFIPASENDFPALMEFQLSNKCNLECIMCSGEYSSGIRANREKEPGYKVPYDDHFVEQLNAFLPHLKKAYFTGGEPFIISIYRKIWRNISEINPLIEINISTNAAFINDETKAIIEKGNFNFTVSIESLNPAHYATIRKNADLAQTLENIKYLQEYSLRRNKVFSVKFVVIKQNRADIKDLFNYFNEQGVQLFPKIVDLPFKYSLLSLSSTELSETITSLESAEYKCDMPMQRQNILRFRDMLSHLRMWLSEISIREKDDFLNQASTEELKLYLEKKLKKHIIADVSLDKDSKMQLYNEMDLFFSKADACETDITALRRAYYAFSAQKPSLIVGEFLRGNIDKLLARFKEEI